MPLHALSRPEFSKHLIIALALLSFPLPVFATSPTKETYQKCYSDDSIPTHFALASDVLSASFDYESDDKKIGHYRVIDVWKGSKKAGSEFLFGLPTYEPDHLLQHDVIYLFFAKPTSNGIYQQASCFYIKILGRKQIHQNSRHIVEVLNREKAKSK